jgi:hypothetical protein
MSEEPHNMIREEMTDDDAVKLIQSLFQGTLLKMAIASAYGHLRGKGMTPFQAFKQVLDSYERATSTHGRHLL